LESEKVKTVVPSVAKAILIDGDGDLQKQVNELTSLLTSLNNDMNMLKNQGTEVVPDSSPSTTQTSVKIPFCTDTMIHGNQAQILTVSLGPNDVVRPEPGSMLHMSDWINCRTQTFGSISTKDLLEPRIQLHLAQIFLGKLFLFASRTTVVARLSARRGLCWLRQTQ
jgi:hypothetical protein